MPGMEKLAGEIFSDKPTVVFRGKRDTSCECYNLKGIGANKSSVKKENTQ